MALAHSSDLSNQNMAASTCRRLDSSMQVVPAHTLFGLTAPAGSQIWCRLPAILQTPFLILHCLSLSDLLFYPLKIEVAGERLGLCPTPLSILCCA